MTDGHESDIILEFDSTRVTKGLSLTASDKSNPSITMDPSGPSVSVLASEDASPRSVAVGDLPVAALDGGRAGQRGVAAIDNAEDERAVTIGRTRRGDIDFSPLIDIRTPDATDSVGANTRRPVGARVGIQPDRGGRVVVNKLPTESDDAIVRVADIGSGERGGRVEVTSRGVQGNARLEGGDGTLVLTGIPGVDSGRVIVGDYPVGIANADTENVDPDVHFALQTGGSEANDSSPRIHLDAATATLVVGRGRESQDQEGVAGGLGVQAGTNDSDGEPITLVETDGRRGAIGVRSVPDDDGEEAGEVRSAAAGLAFTDDQGDTVLRIENNALVVTNRIEEAIGPEDAADGPDFVTQVVRARSGEVAEIEIDTAGWRRLAVRIGSEEVNYVLRATVTARGQTAKVRFDPGAVDESRPTLTSGGNAGVSIDSETNLSSDLDPGDYELALPNFPAIGTLVVM